MIARSPLEVLEGIASVFPTGNLEELLSLYEDDAVFVAEPGKVVQGLAAVREGLGNMLSMGLDFKLVPKKVLEYGEIALVISKWHMKKPGTDEVVVEGRSSDVVRRQADGRWLLAIDNPHGLEWAVAD
ncbi:YybH family protein [Cohnella rhizosphaerae]|uniref:DUF4440 domain-containing protein n=1 Tax=Cohnella rhizosphaerae TaxID=1457232 RepID=A0A9X4KUQ9_9BACL|nr:DUF4440 domain-containing protein [Cohnella rhizosphaerae]MDG0811429.1 DUF4440 domain-containing protein [Cohnella rhizosphaerae]